jgi:hypothetical protein
MRIPKNLSVCWLHSIQLGCQPRGAVNCLPDMFAPGRVTRSSGPILTLEDHLREGVFRCMRNTDCDMLHAQCIRDFLGFPS